MSVFYEIAPLDMELEDCPSAIQAIERLKAVLDEVADSETDFTDDVVDGKHLVNFMMMPSYLSQREIERIDKAIENCATYSSTPITVQYKYDGEEGVDCYAQSRKDKERALHDHHAETASRILSVAGAPFTTAGIKPALLALVTTTRQKSLVFGYYEDTGEFAVFPASGTVDTVRANVEKHLQILSAGSVSIAPDGNWPDSDTFRILDVVDMDAILDWMAELYE